MQTRNFIDMRIGGYEYDNAMLEVLKIYSQIIPQAVTDIIAAAAIIGAAV